MQKQQQVQISEQQPPQQQQLQQLQQHQQWVVMQQQAAAAAALVPPHLMHMNMYYPPLQQPLAPHLTRHEDGRSLWVGDLQNWMDENYLKSCFSATMAVLSAKVIRNKMTGQAGYGFVEFNSRATAEQALQTYNGTVMPRSDKVFQLNWASFGGDRRDLAPDHSIFVGDLGPEVNDATLLETFKNRYPSVRSAKVVTDGNTGRSKCYGFVRFSDDNEKNSAMTEMNGVVCSTRPMRISTATPRKIQAMPPPPPPPLQPKVTYPAPYIVSGPAPAPTPTQASQIIDNNPANTTIFVGGLDNSVGDDDLRRAFSQFGEITYVKIPSGKNCGFVQFRTRASAEEALQKVHGSVIGQTTVRLSWGRSQQKPLPATWAQPQYDPNQCYMGTYYAYPGYETYYTYPQDPAAYGYANYQQQPYGAYPQQVS